MSGSDPDEIDPRLIPLALGAWASAWWGTSPAWPGALGILAALTLAGLWMVRRGSLPAATALVGVVLVCGLAALARHHQLVTSSPAELASQHAMVDVVVRIEGDPVRHPRRGVMPESTTARATTRVIAGRGDAVRQRVPLTLRASGELSDRLASVAPGSTVRLAGRVAPAQAGEHSAAIVAVRAPPQLIRPPGLGSRVVNRVRAGLHESMGLARPEQAGLVPSLVVGDTSHLDADLVDSFKATALTHLTAVSGTNLTLTLAFLLTLARAVGVRGWWVRAIGVAGVVCFVVVCRAEPSVVRASAMGLVALAGLGLAGGRGRGLRHLCVAVWVLMLVDPWLARSIGFALSTLATGGILWWGRRWTDAMAIWAPRWLAESIAIPLAAQLATQPIVTAISGNISIVGLVANALAEPFVGPSTVLGLATMVVALVSHSLAMLLGWVAGWAVQPIIWIALTGSAVPAATWRWPGNPLLITLLTALCLVLAPLVPRMLARPVICVVVATAMVVACLERPRPLGWPGPWQVAFCDVGQGDATLVRASADQAILIDTGPEDGDVISCLRSLGIRAVPMVVLTHFHDDHIAGLESVLRTVAVGQVVVNPVESPPSGAQRVRAVAATHNVPVRTAVMGEHLVMGSADWRVGGLGPQAVLVSSSEGENSAENDTSIVAVVSSGGVRVVVGGDVEPAGQQRVVANGWRPDATVLKMPHHGSSRQDLTFWCDSGARLAVASAGYRNTYGHPARAALALANRCGMDVARTDLQGTITTWVAEGSLQVRGERSGPP